MTKLEATLSDLVFPEFDSKHRIHNAKGHMFNVPCNHNVFLGREFSIQIGLLMTDMGMRRCLSSSTAANRRHNFNLSATFKVQTEVNGEMTDMMTNQQTQLVLGTKKEVVYSTAGMRLCVNL